MKSNIKLMFAGMVFVSASQLAVADEAGYYGAIDLGQSNLKQICDQSLITDAGITIDSYACKNKLTTFRGSLGYQFNDYIGLEVGYVNAGTSTSGFTGRMNAWVCATGCVWIPVSVNGAGSDKLSKLQFVVIGYLPEVNNFSVFGKIGANRWSVTSSGNVTVNGVITPISISDSAFSILLGFGVKYRVNEKLSLRAQLETHKAGSVTSTGLGTVDMMSLGLIYKF